ncbi:YigZ family protein [uncultured Ruminobacter sp.]|uniref:YigZ family protein n=1 Tax=uncultured Ruminobacter sp. TaxID=538947 RepID=UPI0034173189
MSDTTDYMVPALNDGEVFRNELVIKKSRFIASVGHTKGVDEAEAFLNKIRREFPDARHNCHAFNAGRGNETAFIGCSDDGEPKGTAGRPMLNVLVHSGVGEITVVVTRYFGGILLGTGGLVRAYQDSVKAVLDKLPLKEPEDISELRFAAGISEIHLVEKLAVRYGAGITSRDFTDTGCNFRITVNVKRAEELKKELELLHGKYS